MGKQLQGRGDNFDPLFFMGGGLVITRILKTDGVGMAGVYSD